MVKKAILLVSCGSLLGLVATQTASATHPTPANDGAKKVSVAIVPAFQACTSPNSRHGPPLGAESCTPPRQTSPNLTMGPKARSSLTVEVICTNGQAPPCPAPGDQEDVKVRATFTDVRCKAGTTPCPSANSGGGRDYAGEVQSNATIRITDTYNGPPDFTTHGTVVDLPFPLQGTCAATAADRTIGGSCNITSSAGAVVPDQDPIKEGKKMVVEIAQVRVTDGGSDGDVNTPGPPARPNSLFAVQGIYIP